MFWTCGSTIGRNFHERQVRVEGNGMIRMPLIEGEIQAACKTEGELAKDISTVMRVTIAIFRLMCSSRNITRARFALIGAVNEQGRYQMQRRIRLLEAADLCQRTFGQGRAVNHILCAAPRADICATTNDTAKSEGRFISFRLNDTIRGDETANPYVEPR
jgi:hypothetical protein